MAPADAATPEVVLAEGIALVQQGDFEAAVLKLDEATRRLAVDPRSLRSLADAYLYLGISYLELNQELNARAKFLEVLKLDPTRKLSDRVFSPQIIRVFEAARAEMFPNEKKKRSILPLVLIAGGGAASAGIAVATSGGDEPTTTVPAAATSTTLAGTGGGNPTTTSSTVATDPGTPTTSTTTTTTTTSTTLPGTPTTSSTSTTSTTSSTTSPTTTPTTTLPPPTTTMCSFALSPPSTMFITLGGPGTCTVTTQAGCGWTATKSGDNGANWITFTGATSGTGNGSIPYNVATLGILTRTAQIRVGTEECVVVQSLALKNEPPGADWESTLSVEGGRGQIVIDGAAVRYQDAGPDRGTIPPGTGTRQVVALLVAGNGKPGLWSFRLPPGARPGSLRPLAGHAEHVTADSIAFRLTGKPGERVVFTFEALP